MKRLLIIIFLTIAYQSAIQSQALIAFDVTPPNPTEQDSIIITFSLAFPWYAAKKQYGFHYFVGDTIIYNGCYYHPAFLLTESFINDSITVGTLNAGQYRLLVLRSYVYNYGDTNCSNIAFTDTLDTVFVVSAVSSIYQPVHNPLQVLLCGNELRLYSSEQGSVQLVVTNISGSIVQTEQLNAATTTIPINHLPAGLYFVTVQNQQQRIVKKLVKQ